MQPERVDPPQGDPPPAAPRKRFEELLRARTERPAGKAPAPPRRQRTAMPARAPRSDGRAARVPGELRGEARREMDAAARQRLADGQAAGAQATGRLRTRTAELLRAALRTEEDARARSPPRVPTATPGVVAAEMRDAGLVAPGGAAAQGLAGATASASVRPAEERVERALALVERIERLVRSGRPALALTLRGGLPGRLEVQRVAPGAIALRLSSARAPSTADLGELRQALEARGLQVRTLEARRLTTSAEDACSPCP
jgi:hypothetical protein